jgi:outer membrane protein assembly factor BamD (BamD/ComL family)
MSSEHLFDPENDYEEWAKELRAKNLGEAKAKCEAIANREPLTELLSVSQATVTPFNGTYRFICWFKSEVNNDASDDS